MWDPAAMDAQGWHLHVLQQFRDGEDVGVGSLKPYQDTPNKKKHLSGYGGMHF